MVNINGVDYTNNYCGMTIGYEQNIFNVTVVVDGSDIINHFSVETNNKWINIKRMRNELTIVIDKNITLNGRYGVFTFKHNLDSDVFIKFTIWQESCDYNISVDKDYILFDTLLDYDDEDKTEEIINVTTLNGMCDFAIGPVVEYARNFDYRQYRTNEIIFDDDTYYVKNGDSYERGTSITSFPYTIQEGDEYYYYEINDAYREGEKIFMGDKYWYKEDKKYQLLTAYEDITVPENDRQYFRFLDDIAIQYTNGLKLVKQGKTRLKIINYGKTCLYDDFYYIITLYHINNPKCVAQIRIDYVDSFVNNESGFGFDDD